MYSNQYINEPMELQGNHMRLGGGVEEWDQYTNDPSHSVHPPPSSRRHNGASSNRSDSMLYISLDNFEEYLEQSNMEGAPLDSIKITSPRSLYVCMENGVDPADLMPLKLTQIERTIVVNGTRNALGKEVNIELTASERRTLAQERYVELEDRRQATLHMLRQAREEVMFGDTSRAASHDRARTMSAQRADSPLRASMNQEDLKRQLMWERDIYKQDYLARQKSAEERHRQVRQKAEFLKKLNHELFVSEQIAKEKFHRERIRKLHFNRALDLERRRLQAEKAHEHAERVKRMQGYQEWQKKAQKSQAETSPSDPTCLKLMKEVQKYRIQAAKHLYADRSYRQSRSLAQSAREYPVDSS